MNQAVFSVQDIFEIKGKGLVLTGKLLNGILQVGMAANLGGTEAFIKSIEVPTKGALEMVASSEKHANALGVLLTGINKKSVQDYLKATPEMTFRGSFTAPQISPSELPQQLTPKLSTLPQVVLTVLALIIFISIISFVFLRKNPIYERSLSKITKQEPAGPPSLATPAISETRSIQLPVGYIKGPLAKEEIRSFCIDSDVNEKPWDIYIKGYASIYPVDSNQVTRYDECTGSKLQVNEMWCYESPQGSGNYVIGNLVYDCPKGCLDGACTR